MNSVLVRSIEAKIVSSQEKAKNELRVVDNNSFEEKKVKIPKSLSLKARKRAFLELHKKEFNCYCKGLDDKPRPVDALKTNKSKNIVTTKGANGKVENTSNGGWIDNQGRLGSKYGNGKLCNIDLESTKGINPYEAYNLDFLNSKPPLRLKIKRNPNVNAHFKLKPKIYSPLTLGSSKEEDPLKELRAITQPPSSLYRLALSFYLIFPPPCTSMSIRKLPPWQQLRDIFKPALFDRMKQFQISSLKFNIELRGIIAENASFCNKCSTTKLPEVAISLLNWLKQTVMTLDLFTEDNIIAPVSVKVASKRRDQALQIARKLEKDNSRKKKRVKSKKSKKSKKTTSTTESVVQMDNKSSYRIDRREKIHKYQEHRRKLLSTTKQNTGNLQSLDEQHIIVSKQIAIREASAAIKNVFVHFRLSAIKRKICARKLQHFIINRHIQRRILDEKARKIQRVIRQAQCKSDKTSGNNKKQAIVDSENFINESDEVIDSSIRDKNVCTRRLKVGEFDDPKNDGTTQIGHIDDFNEFLGGDDDFSFIFKTKQSSLHRDSVANDDNLSIDSNEDFDRFMGGLGEDVDDGSFKYDDVGLNLLPVAIAEKSVPIEVRSHVVMEDLNLGSTDGESMISQNSIPLNDVVEAKDSVGIDAENDVNMLIRVERGNNPVDHHQKKDFKLCDDIVENTVDIKSNFEINGDEIYTADFDQDDEENYTFDDDVQSFDVKDEDVPDELNDMDNFLEAIDESNNSFDPEEDFEKLSIDDFDK